MNNILDAINTLSDNKELKKRFIEEFNKNINGLPDGEEKWKNYKTFLQHRETQLSFLDHFDYIFIVNELIIKAVGGSNLSKDNLSEIFFDELKEYFYRKSIKGLKSDELDHSKDLLRDFGIILKQSLLDGGYSGLENHELYKSLKNNVNFIYVILYIVLSYIKSNSDYKVEDLPEFFSGIYQYYHLHRQKSEFSIHLLLVTIIAVFFEKQNKSFQTQRMNQSSYRESHQLSILIESIKLEDKDEDFLKIFNLLKEFNLLFNFLLKLEENKWVSKNFIEKSLKLLLSKDDLLSSKNIISFSNFFSDYEEELYLNTVKLIEFKEEDILSTLNNAESDTIMFLNIDGNKKYITNVIKKIIVNILKEKLQKKITLDDNYYLMYKYIINLGENLNILLQDFEYDLINEFIKDEEGLSFTFKHIDKFLIKNDLHEFYYLLIKKYIETMTSGEIFSAKDFRETLDINDKIIKDNLKRIKSEGILINGASGISRYKVI